MLVAVAAAGGTASVAAVEAEGAGGVAALPGRRLGGEALAQHLEGADIAGGVGTRGAADAGLVEQQHVGDGRIALDALVFARRALGMGLELAQGPVEHLLDQGRLAGARDARHHHQAVERDGDVDVLEVVGAGAAHLQPAVAVRGLACRTGRGDLAASGEIVAGQGVGRCQESGRRTLKDDAPSVLAWARADVDEAVGGPHHLRVVLDDHQRVAPVAQSVQNLGHPVHVARMQPDTGLVEDEEAVDQRGPERGGQVDALHLAPRERPRLTVEGQIAEPDLAQIAETGADLGQQQVERLVERSLQPERLEEVAAAGDRQAHEVVDGESGQVVPGRLLHAGAGMAETLGRW
ncbi:hypothetical protein D779_4087 [Imhoffiella purpurea]|uniref:Uncharacterized protein n=1 Tax=Imhoffiella purpurea TaxID=1249627 RepID=W9UYG1_9GAMM|nr:hypothetical protein D779_4087 [Imhoffiella purpurea]